MEPPLSTLIFVVVGFLICVHALLVESQSQDESLSNKSPPPSSTQRPPPRPSPRQHPPPSTPSPPARPSLSPPPLSRQPPSQSSPSPSPHRPPLRGASPPKNINSQNEPARPRSAHRHSNHDRTDRGLPPPPPPQKSKINAGKKIGLLFAGIAAILQLGVVGFLVFKRRQLLKVKYDS